MNLSIITTVALGALLSSLAFVSTGCVGPSSQDSAYGKATYAKPASEGGQPVKQQQQPDDLQIQMTVDGTATWDAVAGTACSLTSGDYSASTQTSGSITSDGNYAAFYQQGQLDFHPTNPLCSAVQNINVKSVTSVTIKATLPPNDQNCTGYCQGEAQVQCQGSSDQASCESDFEASCHTSCMSSHHISGHGEASLQALTQINDEATSSASSSVDANVDIVFDSLE